MVDEPGVQVAAWVDNHCHLGDEHLADGDDRETVVQRAREAGVVALVDVGTSLETSREAVAAARSLPGVRATVGLHPHDAVDGCAGLADLVRDGLTDGAVVAVGECGLDYHYDHSPRDTQRRVFVEQIELAHEFDLPLVIHTRSAWDDTFDVLDQVGTPSRTVFHCFTGGPDEAAAALERGALLSISGIVTFPSAPELRDAVAATPLERLMVETDSPYLAPVPHRGRRNEPAWVVHVGQQIADLHGVDVDRVARATTATAMAFYGLDPDGSDRRTDDGPTDGSD